MAIKVWSTKQFAGSYAAIAYEGEVSKVPALCASLLAWSNEELELAKADWARLKPGLNFTDWLGALIAKAGEKLHSKAGARLEYYYQADLALLLNGKREVSLPPFGRVDILTKTHAIEVKHASLFKHALGQALCYAYVTKLAPGIALYGEHSINKHIGAICLQHNVALWLFENEQWHCKEM